MKEWTAIKDFLPDAGKIVWTKIDDAQGKRNEAKLKRVGSLWFFEDESAYVYYCPTHWKPI